MCKETKVSMEPLFYTSRLQSIILKYCNIIDPFLDAFRVFIGGQNRS